MSANASNKMSGIRAVPTRRCIIQRISKIPAAFRPPADFAASTPAEHLTFAVGAGDVKNVRWLLASQPSLINSQDPSGDLPLGQAADSGLNGILEVLLWSGANINQKNRWGDTPLLQAIASGKPKTVSILLRYGADPDLANGTDSPLVMAISAGQTGLVSKLLKAGANPNKQIQDDTPLIMAVSANNLAIVSKLLHFGADPNQGGEETPLYHATQLRGAKALVMAKTLIDLGAAVNSTALFGAIETRNLKLMKLMLSVPGVDLTEPPNSGALHAVLAKFPAATNLIVEVLTDSQRLLYVERARARMKEIDELGGGLYDDFKSPDEAVLRALGVE
jgi:ankyrin repeat protein